MPELIDDDSDDLTLWSGLLFNMMQDHSMDNFDTVPIMNVPIMNVPIVNNADAESDSEPDAELPNDEPPSAEPPNAITIDYVPSLYNVETRARDIVILYSFI